DDVDGEPVGRVIRPRRRRTADVRGARVGHAAVGRAGAGADLQSAVLAVGPGRLLSRDDARRGAGCAGFAQGAGLPGFTRLSRKSPLATGAFLPSGARVAAAASTSTS